MTSVDKFHRQREIIDQTKQNRSKYDWTIQSDWAKEEFKFEL